MWHNGAPVDDDREQLTVEGAEQVVEGMPVGFLALDADWTITQVNAAAEHAVSRPREELLGRDYWEAFPDNRHNAFGETSSYSA